MPRRRNSRSCAQSTSQLAAPHFVWYVLEELRSRLCGDAETCTALDQGGLRVVTTMDWAPEVGREVGPGGHARAAPLRPCRCCPRPGRALRGLDAATCVARTSGTARSRPSTTSAARSSPTSARRTTTRRRKVNKRIQPQYDVLRLGWRQPGSAFKPFNYVTGIDAKTMTASIDDHGRDHRLRPGYMPTDFDRLRARPAAGSPRAPVLAQHPVRQGARHDR